MNYNDFSGKILLITGGTGSFGTTMLSKLLNSPIKEIRIFSRDEKKQDDLRNQVKNKKVKFFIGDVRDYQSVERVMYNVDFVFHAAALKQVPSCEFFPIEAVKTNVLGAENVMRAAIAYQVSKVVILSTDKAVYPINAMGMSKALMEKTMIALSREYNNSTILCGTRYGNVMASRGSVIPLFIQQIKENRPLTITDPEMTRYMMTLDDAIDLVIYAFRNGKPGDIFVQKSPAATLDTLSKALKQIYNAQIETKVIGTRHGEKLYETLVNREEMIKAIDLENYYRIPADNRDLNYERYFTIGETHVSGVEEYTSHNTYRLNLQETIKLLMKLEIIKNEIK